MRFALRSAQGLIASAVLPLSVIAAAPDILVTATRTAQSLADIPASVTVLDADDIRRSAPLHAGDLLRDLAGADLQGGGLPGYETKLSLRGLTPGFQTKRVLVLIDGRRVNEQFQGNAELGQLPVDDIERIEILRGPASALYGSNAMGGVLNIITRRGRQSPGLSLSAAAGSHDTRQYRIGTAGVLRAADYALAVGHVETDGYLRNSDGSRRDWAADHADMNIGWHQGETVEFRAFAGLYRGVGADNSSDRTVERDYQMLLGRWMWDPPRRGEWVARLYRNGDHLIYDWTYPGLGDYDQQTLGGELQHAIWLLDTHRVIAGLDVRHEGVDVTEVQYSLDESTHLLAGYLQDEMLLGPAWRLTAGLRFDHDADFGGEWSPRAGLLWHALPALDLFGAWNRAHRAPSLSDRYVRQEYMGMMFVGNPDLKPETLTAFELGGRWRPSDRATLAITAFHNDMEDSFDFILDADGVFRNQNVSDSRTFGMESELTWRLCDRLSLRAWHTWTEGEYRNDLPAPSPAIRGNTLAYLAVHRAGAEMTYATPAGQSHRLGLRYVGKRPGDAQNSPEREMDDYMTLTWRSRLPLWRGVAATLSLDNLLDDEFEDFPGVPQPGRWVMVGVDARF